MNLTEDNLQTEVASESWPLVTIVTPAYNQGEYLEQTMRSVLEQDYPALEYIVIDDGSSDDSLVVAQRVAAEYPGRVTVLTQPNSGQAATLNKGWAMAQGEVLAYLSSDDCLLPHAVLQMVRTLQANPCATVVYCDFWLINSSGRRLRESITEEFNSRRLRIDLVCQPGPGAFFRRMVYDKAGGWNPTLRQVPDFEFWLRAEQYGPFVRVPQLLAEYRIHEGSASFRVMPVERADEIAKVINCYWSGKADKAGAPEAMARAYTLAAKNHAQSGRLGMALFKFWQGIRLNSRLLMDIHTWRALASGVFRHTYYRVKS